MRKTQRITRRAVLKAAAGAAASALPGLSVLSSMSAAAQTSEEAPARWTFDGVTGPEHWSELSPDYALCQFGVEQSPIDLVDATQVPSARGLDLDYRPITARASSRSWTLQIGFDPGCEIEIGGVRYALGEAYVRQPSEHLLSGRALEMELQLVHRSKTGATAISGVFIRQGREHEALKMLIEHLPAKGADKGTLFPIDPTDFLPALPEGKSSRAFYRYEGSMTMPPCTEGVVWTVFKTPIEASPKQIRDLATLFPPNARPANKLNQRQLFEFGG